MTFPSILTGLEPFSCMKTKMAVGGTIMDGAAMMMTAILIKDMVMGIIKDMEMVMIEAGIIQTVEETRVIN